MNQQHKPGLKVWFSHSLSKHEALAAAATCLSIHLPVKEDTTLNLKLDIYDRGLWRWTHFGSLSPLLEHLWFSSPEGCDA